MINSTSKRRNYVKLRKIWRNKMLTRAAKYVGIALFSLVGQGGSLRAETSGDEKDNKKPVRKEYYAKTLMKSIVAAEVDVQGEIDKRVDWFLGQYVETLKEKQDELKAIGNYNSKRNYIKKNFFDRVFEAGRVDKNSNYCVAAALSCLLDVNERAGDLDEFFPDGSTKEGAALVSSTSLANYVKKNYEDCLEEYIYRRGNVLKTKSGKTYNPDGLKPGTILQLASSRASSGWHTVVYIGEGLVLSFNRDRIYNLNKSIKTKVIDLPGIIKQEWSKKIKEMPRECRDEPVALLTELYEGRGDDFIGALQAYNIFSKDEAIQFAPVSKDFAEKGENLELLNNKKTFNAWHMFAKMAGKNIDL